MEDNQAHNSDAQTPGKEAFLGKLIPTLEKEIHHHWIEVISTVLLALATIGSAWCAYQANKWSATETFKLRDAGGASSDATEEINQDMESRIGNTMLLIQYMTSEKAGNKEMADFFKSRVTSDTQPAVEAWIAMNPLTNPDAPRSPFLMPEYKPPRLKEARELQAASAKASEEGRKAAEYATTYVSMTVLFASILFFAGLGGKLRSVGYKTATLLIGMVIFIGTAIVVPHMPIAHWQ